MLNRRLLAFAAVVVLTVGCTEDTPLESGPGTSIPSFALAKNTWSRLADVPIAKVGSLVGYPKANGDTWLYSIGGSKVSYTANGYPKFAPLGNTWAWDPAKNTWSKKANAPYVWWYGVPQAVVIGTKIYVPGGAGKYFYRNTMAVYDVPSNTWSVVTTPQPGSGGAVWVSGNALYWAGTCEDSDFSDGGNGSCEFSGARSPFLLRYTPSTKSWQYLTPPSVVGDAFGAAAGFLYLTGAYTDPALNAYDLNAGRWVVRQPIDRARNGAASVAAGGKFYVLSGRMLKPDGVTWGNSRATSEYNPSTNLWTNRAQVPEILFGLAARIVVGGQVRIVLMGSPATGFDNEHEHFWQYAP